MVLRKEGPGGTTTTTTTTTTAEQHRPVLEHLAAVAVAFEHIKWVHVLCCCCCCCCCCFPPALGRILPALEGDEGGTQGRYCVDAAQVLVGRVYSSEHSEPAVAPGRDTASARGPRCLLPHDRAHTGSWRYQPSGQAALVLARASLAAALWIVLVSSGVCLSSGPGRRSPPPGCLPSHFQEGRNARGPTGGEWVVPRTTAAGCTSGAR